MLLFLILIYSNNNNNHIIVSNSKIFDTINKYDITVYSE